MIFLQLDKNCIVENAKKVDTWYVYELGNPVEITTLKSKDANNIIARNLSSKVIEDKFMLRYSPTNIVYFSEAFIESDSNFGAFYIDNKSYSIYVGTNEEFGTCSGVLMFSGKLSINDLVEEHVKILGNNKVLSTIMSRVHVLSVGARGDNLFALYYIPSSRGIAIGTEGNVGISVNTLKERNCDGYKSFTIEDWFSYAKVVEKGC